MQTAGSKLLVWLDRVFGYPNKIDSGYKKHRQWFDEAKNEHVVIIEYRIQVGHAKKKKQYYNKEPVREDDRLTDTDLIRDINDQAKLFQVNT